MGKWIDGEGSTPGAPTSQSVVLLGRPRAGLTSLKVTAAGAWQDDRTFQMQCRFYETPHHDTITCRFDGDRVIIEFLSSINQLYSVRETRPVLHGRIST
jgi:hypothetical protein